MSSYLLQPDGGGNCCDCPARSGPCDNCIACALPRNDCPHAVCFDINISSTDTSDRDFCDVQTGSFILLGVFFDGTNWNVYTNTDSKSMVATSPRDTWHTFNIQFFESSGTVRAHWFVDGVAGTDVLVTTTGELPFRYRMNNVVFGARYGSTGDAHRTMKNIVIKPKPATTEVGFDFPPGPFDLLVGGASIIAGPELQIAALSNTDGYAEKDLSPAYDMLCSPVTGCDCTRNISITVRVQTQQTHGVDGGGQPCNFHADHTITPVSQFGENLCSVSYGPFNNTYAGYDVGILDVNSIIIGLGGGSPAPICISYSIDAGFETNSCGAGSTHYNTSTDCFAVCTPPSSIVRTWTTPILPGPGDFQMVTVTITFT